ncbi:MAG TPA: CBS domain-containing protein [Desulfomonilia bacterium]|jgi:acetoin utilization protein AcuB
MRVNDWMIKNVVTIGSDSSVLQALSLMKKKSVRHLPVVDAGKFVGLITSTDAKQAILTGMLETLRVGDIMMKNPVTVTRETTLEEASRIIYEQKVSSLPVVEKGKILGILTIIDILKAFIDLMGVLKSGSRIDVILKQVNGSFDEVVSIIEAKGGYIISVGMSLNEDDTIHHFRVSGGNIKDIAEELHLLGYRGVKVTG